MGAQAGEEGEEGEGEGLGEGEEEEDGAPLGDVEPPFEIATLLEKAKFYTSLCLGTTAILSVFAFLFLIPFVVDPAISSIMSDFDQDPVTCITVEHVYAEGLRNCSWASCREGCTSSQIRCHQLLVNYSRVPFREWRTQLFNTSEPVPPVPEPTLKPPPSKARARQRPRPQAATEAPDDADGAEEGDGEGDGDGDDGGSDDDAGGVDPAGAIAQPQDVMPETLPMEYRHRLSEVAWDIGETRFFINTEGCGYPPKVNCSIFAKHYGGRHMFKPFPCYYSRVYPEQVVARYSWDDNLRNLVLSLIVPNVLFGISVGVLSYWYCPSCNRGGCGSNKKPFIEKMRTKMTTTKRRRKSTDEAMQPLLGQTPTQPPRPRRCFDTPTELRRRKLRSYT